MLFARSSDEHAPRGHRPLAVARDVVEIVAIVAAGIWAFYTFVYAERVKPYLDPPNVSLSVAIDRLGARGKLEALRLHTNYSNPGKTDARVLGVAETLVGERVADHGETLLRRVASIGAGQLVTVTRGGSVVESEVAFEETTTYPRFQGWHYFTLQPGETQNFERIVFVPRGRYDALALHLNVAYTGDLRSDFRIEASDQNGIGTFSWHGTGACLPMGGGSCPIVSTGVVASVSLW